MKVVDRIARVVEILGLNLPAEFPLREFSDEEWLRSHPGGFAASSKASQGSFFGVCPERVAMVGAHLSNEGFDQFCWAIRTWQHGTLLDVLLRLPGDLMVAKFDQDHPEEAEVLRGVAGTNRIPLQHFLGVD